MREDRYGFDWQLSQYEKLLNCKCQGEKCSRPASTVIRVYMPAWLLLAEEWALRFVQGKYGNQVPYVSLNGTSFVPVSVSKFCQKCLVQAEKAAAKFNTAHKDNFLISIDRGPQRSLMGGRSVAVAHDVVDAPKAGAQPTRVVAG